MAPPPLLLAAAAVAAALPPGAKAAVAPPPLLGGAAPGGAEVLGWPGQWPETCCAVGLLLATAAANAVFFVGAGAGRPAAGDGSCGHQASELRVAVARDLAPPPPPGKPPRVGTEVLTGLRGLAALHVALGHYSGMSAAGVDLLGGASMSFFYLLSGFIMTVGYARELTDAACRQEGAPSHARLDARRFWKNRFARLFPSYLLTNLLCFALSLCFFDKLDPGDMGGNRWTMVLNFGYSLLGLNVWLYPLNYWIPDTRVQVLVPPNIVTWTIQTMAVFYLVFPFLLPWLRGVRRRRRALLLLYGLQATTFMAILLFGFFVVRNVFTAYWGARAWPPSRLPVFAMGCLLAVERMHGEPPEGDGADAPAAAAAPTWGARATVCGLAYLGILAVGTVLMALLKPAGTSYLEAPVGFWLVRAIWEALTPILFLCLIYSLTLCESSGLLARLCNSRPLQWFGDISMTFYLSHYSILEYTNVVIRGQPYEAPLWLCACCLATSVAVGWVLATRFEAPCRRWLRS